MELTEAVAAATSALEPYLARSAAGDGPVVSRPPVAEVAQRLDLERWIRDGGMDVPALADWLERYLQLTTRLHHPQSLAHQVAVPDVPAAVADLVHGAINNPMGIYEMGAAAATIELAIVDWMAQQIGFPGPGAGGVLTHGGSLANLTALLAARAQAAPDAWSTGTPPDLALLCTPSAHYSIARAAGILGLGTDAIIPLPVDDLDRIDPDRMGESLAAARAAGRRPFALVAAACATSTGLYDDLDAAADFAAAHGLWLHVDGAHGASALLSPAHRARLAGIDRADSVVWDAHKLLRVSGLCAAVLVRDETALDAAFRQQASYLFYEDHDGAPGPDLLARTVECTKAALGVKVFLELATRGERGLGADVAERFAVAHDAYELLRERRGFSVPYAPETNIVCFRVDGDDAHQVAVRDRLLADGDVHISSALVGGRRHLRLVVTAPATTRATLGRTIDRVAAVSSGLRQGR